MTGTPLAAPHAVLGVARDAPPDEIRRRYVELIKLHPPDRDPAAFERIRDAFAALTDPHAVARRKLFGPPPLDDLDELEALLRAAPPGPAEAAAWLAAARERRTRGHLEPN